MSKQRKMTVLGAILAAALLGQATARASTAGMFGVRATFEPTNVVFEMRLAALCVRLQAEIPAFIVASARMLACEQCARAPSARSWS